MARIFAGCGDGAAADQTGKYYIIVSVAMKLNGVSAPFAFSKHVLNRIPLPFDTNLTDRFDLNPWQD